MTREEATIYIKEWLKDEYLDSKDRAALTAIIEESEQEPKYCDRNICIRNEHNGIGCGECEVTKSQEPCEDWYDVPSDEMTLEQARQAVKDLRKMWAEHLEQEPKTGHCKECKYFEYDNVETVYGIPLIVHEICSKWGNGCKTREDGYCFLFEPQESEVEE